MRDQAPATSVIVATHSRLALLTRTLDALVRQAWPKDRLELVVVDNNSSDDRPHSCSSSLGRRVCRASSWRQAATDAVRFVASPRAGRARFAAETRMVWFVGFLRGASLERLRTTG